MSELKNSFLERTDTLLGKFVTGMAILAGIGTFAMAIMICVSVIMRYFFKMSVAWATEWSEYLIYIDVMLAAPWVLKIDKHVRVDVISNLLTKPRQKILNQCISVLGVLMCGMFFYFSLQATLGDLASGVKMVRIIPVPRWFIMAFLPLMSFSAILVFLRKIILLARHKEIQTDIDYQEFEENKMNPRYNTHSSTSLELLEYDEIAEPEKEADRT